MHFNQLDEAAIATRELYSHLKQQVSVIAAGVQPLVSANITVERVGFTRNASNTPYMVYWVNDRRCCTFIKRSRFLELVQMLLKLKYNIEDRIKGVASSVDFGLWVKAGDCQQYIPSSYVKKFFERFNKLAVERTAPVSCDCNDLYDMCLHQIAKVFQLRLE